MIELVLFIGGFASGIITILIINYNVWKYNSEQEPSLKQTMSYDKHPQKIIVNLK